MKNESKQIIQMANPDQIVRLKASFDEFKKFAENKKIKVKFNLNQHKIYPFNSIGSVELRGRSMEITDCDWLTEISKLADNISITPYTDGTFDYCLTFCDTMVTIPEEED